MELAQDIAKKEDDIGFKNGFPTHRCFRGFKKRINLSLRQPVNILVDRMLMETSEMKNELFYQV